MARYSIVKRQRKYYKDGVEVPESSITDFGGYKYFKNVVTTKYWKEITTGSKELGYYCYYLNRTLAGYFYASPKLDVLYYSYVSSNGTTFDAVSSPEQLKEFYSGGYRNLTADSVQVNVGVLSSNYVTVPRLTTGDLYIDTTVTETVEGTPEDYTYTTEEIVPVEVSADDEYDFTEFVPSAEFDYYEDNNKLYIPTRRRREYYKYGTEPNVGIVGSPTIVDGVASGFTTANYLTTPKVFNPLGSEVECVFKVNLVALNRMNTMISQGANVQFNKFLFCVLKTGQIRFNAGNGSSTIVRVDSDVVLEINKDYWLKLHIKDNVYSLYYSLDGKDYIFDNSVTDPDIIREMTTTAYIGANRDPAVGSSSYFNGSIDLQQSYIKINGEDWWHGTKIVRLNVDGEDIWEDWEQPVLTSDTSSSKIVLSSSSTYGSNYPMWGAFDNGSGAWLSEDRTGSGSLRVSFPSKLKISRITVTGWGNTADRTKAITIYKDFDNTEVAGETQTFDGAVTKTWIFDTPIITNKLSFYAESTTGYWACIDEIKITAQELKIPSASIEDAEWYEDRNVAYDIRS